MPRPKRIMSNSSYYHVMYRGNNKEYIFSEDRMKELFMSLIKPIADEEKVGIAAYCIMNNHIHLILKSDFSALSNFSGKLNRKYAMRFNIKHNRTGHAFEDRFRSEPINDDSYLLQVIRYVHNNPVNAGIIKDAAQYKWSSYREYSNDKPFIVDADQMKLLMDMYGGIDSFVDFHKQYDDSPHLDTKEDQNRNIEKREQRVIGDFFETNGMIDYKQLANRQDLLEELVKILHSEISLSQQKISGLLGISKRAVQYILTEKK